MMVMIKRLKNMRTGYIFRRSIILAAAVLFVFAGEAKLKGLPVMKNFKNYSFKKPDVESVKYTVYAAKVEGETVTKGEIADFIAETFFDEKGYRVKEIVYNMEGEVDVKISWQYNETAGTVVETRIDKNDKLLARTEYMVNYKFSTVIARRYENVEDLANQITYDNVLRYEELWTENAKQKKAIFKKTHFDFRDGIAARQSISEQDMEKPYTLYLLLESLTAPIDYTWLYDYSEKAFKAANGKTKKEPVYDGSRYEYKAKSKLLSDILYFDKDKKLKNETNYIYSFDSRKNWTEVIQKENNSPKFIVIRDIKYRF
jgi:hypothetical protein